MGEIKRSHKTSVTSSEGKRPLARPRHRREDNIKMHLTEIAWRVLVNTLISLQVHKRKEMSSLHGIS
jgi:hypothetical protein